MDAVAKIQRNDTSIHDTRYVTIFMSRMSDQLEPWEKKKEIAVFKKQYYRKLGMHCSLFLCGLILDLLCCSK